MGGLQACAQAPLIGAKFAVRLSVRIISLPVRVVTVPFRFSWTAGRPDNLYPAALPIGGLSEEGQRKLAYALSEAARSKADAEVAVLWADLTALTQEASNRLLEELEEATQDLIFWKQRAMSRNQRLFMLLGRGPKRLAREVVNLFSGRSRRMLVSDRIQRRIVVLEATRTRLARAVAEVHAVAATMRVLHHAEQEIKRKREAIAAQGHAAGVSRWQTVRLHLKDLDGAETLINVTKKSIGKAAIMLSNALDGIWQAAVLQDKKTPLQQLGISSGVPATPTASGMLEAQAVAAFSSARHSSREATPSTPAPPPSTPAPHVTERIIRSHSAGHLGTPGTPQSPYWGEVWPEPKPVKPPTPYPSRVGDGSQAAHAAKAEEAQDQVPCLAVLKELVAHARLVLKGNEVARSPEIASEGVTAARSAGWTARPNYPFGLVPEWASRPSPSAQAFLSNTAKVVASLFGGRWLLKRHMDGKLKKWMIEGRKRGVAAYHHNIVDPLEKVADHLFETFRQRPAIVDREDVKISRESLQRMLTDFAADNGQPITGNSRSGRSSAVGAAVGETETMIRGMEVLMRKYEAELRHPIRSALLGHLPQALLIQVQKLKVDTETAMLQLDQILRANELTISLVAALPALGVLLVTAFNLPRFVFGRDQGAMNKATACKLRMAMVDVDRALEEFCNPPTEQFGSPVSKQTTGGAALGFFLYRLHILYSIAHQMLIQTSTQGTDAVGSEYSTEWPNFQADILDLAASTKTPEQKMAISNRMGRVYSCLQHPSSSYQL